MSLATEIKSEIREVINQVEDVLSLESADESGSDKRHGVEYSPQFSPTVVINPPVFDLGSNQQSMAVSARYADDTMYQVVENSSAVEIMC